MRLVWFMMLTGVLLLGCRSSKAKKDTPETPSFGITQPGNRKTAKPAVQKQPMGGVARPSSASSAATNAAPATAPTPGLIKGKVLSVNGPLRYVVLDFTLFAVPPRGAIVELFRQGQKVSVVRVTGPQRDTVTAADVVEGAPQVGDEARALQP